MAALRPVLMIIDDDPLITDTLHFVLSKHFEVCVAESHAQLKSLLQQLDSPPALALVDLGLPPNPHTPEEGFKVISALLTHSPTIKIHVLSGQSDDANVKRALSLGAVDFIAKPCDVDKLKDMLLNALKVQNVELNEVKSEQVHGGLLGESLPIQALRMQIQQFADSPFPVLIEGESGSGKELVASSFHYASQRLLQPYLSINCAAVSPLLAESILFGHAKGAFTGAVAAHAGYFEDAGEGTLFLDEIGELPLELQAKLLRVLENGEYQRIGETQTRKSRARIVAATNRDLRAEVRAGKFRSDLYHRLSVFTVHVPSLRELGDDKHLLREHFVDFYAKQISKAPFALDADAQARWLEYDFPGNVRELRNIVIRLIAKYAGKTIKEKELVAEFDLTQPEASGDQFNFNDEAGMTTQAQRHLQRQANVSLDAVLKTWERAYIEAAMKITHGNLSQAAKLLNVNRTTLYSRMNTSEDS
ncbi:MAG: sigma-54-dependent Fis family transcriptional regulator [Methylotenera sp.]|jgi:DNA-binding NtrC family response regulator|nr:sigma-54 dependent transcriptional regulator [Methylotenera sp.]MDD4925242.1 sigma-54 dependent transcriptional regulator [Methylotenera sp.]NOS94899.1 sigma-54-dependent Fis family transcriptional regulator [Methylotenera sp.]NOU41850.1 sigma-54-dependent Fis family transcriptional regulator [Methylotenera sp.]